MLTVLQAFLVDVFFSACVGLALRIPKEFPGASGDRVAVTPNGTMRRGSLVSVKGTPQVNLSQFEQVSYDGNHTVYFNDDLDVILDPQTTRPPDVNLIHGAPGPALREGIKHSPEGRKLLNKFLECKIKAVQYMDRDNRIYELIHHHGRGVLFTHVFKNGGTSVAKFAMQNGGQFITHDNLNQTQMHNIYNNPTYFRGAIVRHPVDRVLASFVESMCLVIPEECNREASEDPSYWLGLLEFFLRLSYIGHFDDVPIGFHFWPQVRFLADSNGTKRPIEYLGRMENYEKEVRFMFPFDGKLPHKKNHKGFRINASMLTPRLLIQICKVYIDDFCCFGYDFPEPCKGVISCEAPHQPAW